MVNRRAANIADRRASCPKEKFRSDVGVDRSANVSERILTLLMGNRHLIFGFRRRSLQPAGPIGTDAAIPLDIRRARPLRVPGFLQKDQDRARQDHGCLRISAGIHGSRQARQIILKFQLHKSSQFYSEWCAKSTIARDIV